MRISQATPLSGPFQPIAGACAHSDAATAEPAAHATAPLGAASPQGRVALPSMVLDHRVAAKVAVADELRRAVEEQQKRLRELQAELDAAQDEAGSFLSWFGAWMVGADGGVADLSGSAHDVPSLGLRHLTARQQDTQLAGTVSQGTHETYDDLRRRLG